MNQAIKEKLESRVGEILEKIKDWDFLEDDWLKLKIEELTRAAPRTRATQAWERVYWAFKDWHAASGEDDIISGITTCKKGEHDVFNNLINTFYDDTGIIPYFSSNVALMDVYKNEVYTVSDIPTNAKSEINKIALALDLKIKQKYATCLNVKKNKYINYYKNELWGDRLTEIWTDYVGTKCPSVTIPADSEVQSLTQDSVSRCYFADTSKTPITLADRIILTYYMAYNTHLQGKKMKSISMDQDDYEDTMPIFQSYACQAEESENKTPEVVTI